jgi:hypothetical protein
VTTITAPDNLSADSAPSWSSRRAELCYASVFGALTLALMWRFLLHGGDIISHGDVNAYANGGDRLHDLTTYLFNDFGSVSNLENYNTTLFVQPMVSLLSFFGIESGVNLYRAGTLAFIITSYASITYFLRWLFFEKSSLHGSSWRLAQFTGAMFFVLSPYVLNVYAAGGFWLAYGLTPVFIVATYKLFADKPSIANTVLYAVVSSFLVVGTQYLFFSAFIAVCIAAVELTIRARRKALGWSYAKRLGAHLALFTALFTALNAHWLLASLAIYSNGEAISPGYVVTRDMIGMLGARANMFTTAISADSWTQVDDHRFGALQTYSTEALFVRYVLVVASLIGILCVKHKLHRRITGTLLAFFLLFWAFSIGLHNPVYAWLALDSPVNVVGWIFRSPSKLTYIFWLLYAMGFTVIVKLLIDRTPRSARVLVPVAMTALVILPSINKFYSVFNFYFVPTTLPTEYRQTYDLLKQLNSDEQHKVAFLAPYHYGFGKNEARFEASFTWDPQKMAGQIIEQSSPVPSVGYWHMTYRNWQENLYRNFYPEFSQADPNAAIPRDLGRLYLGPANIKYLVFHNDIVNAEQEGEQTIRRLDGTDLRRIARIGFITVYENPFAQPLISTENNRSAVAFEKVNPTKYRFSASLVNGDERLLFAQAYDPMWKMTVDGKTIDAESFGRDALTAFRPGAQTVNGEITYLPQAAYSFGKNISMPTLALSGIALVALSWRRRSNDEPADQDRRLEQDELLNLDAVESQRETVGSRT